MIVLTQFRWISSLIPLLFHFFQVFRKVIFMGLRSKSPFPSSPRRFSCICLRWMDFTTKRRISSPVKFPQGNKGNVINPVQNLPSDPRVSVSEGLVLVPAGEYPQVNLHFAPQDIVRKGDVLEIDEGPQENMQLLPQKFIDKSVNFTRSEIPVENSMASITAGFKSTATCKGGEVKVSGKVRKRPARIIIPQSCEDLSFDEAGVDLGENESLVEGKDFYLASKRGRGRRKPTEDGYDVITNIHGDSKQAYFGVYDGHGGRAAVEYAVEKLGKNIITALGEIEEGESQLEEAIREGYLSTDNGFLSKHVGSGTCASTVILKDGELHVAHVGDCRVVLSRKGTAEALTSDHRVDREDEQLRIERMGGYVSCHNGIWRVQGSLAVSRAIGDGHLKEWIISEPETRRIRLTSDCEFLIMASDGLWDTVANQEAVDVVKRNKNSIESCKKLVDLASGRGSKDDITALVVYLQNFTHMGASETY